MKKALKTLWSGSIDERRQVHLMLAEAIDAWRVVPRLLVLCYGYLVWDVVQWFMNLGDPTSQHAALVSTVVGVAGAVIGIYTNTGRKWSEHSFKFWGREKKDENNDDSDDSDERITTPRPPERQSNKQQLNG